MHAAGDQISIQEAQLYLHFVMHAVSWASNREIAAAAKLNEGTVRHHARSFFERGLLDRVHAHPGYRYRYKTGGDEAYKARLIEAMQAFGLAGPGEV
jgi:hypothetical protein